MTCRWPSTAETFRHRLTNKYDPTTVVFWRTHPPSSTVRMQKIHTSWIKIKASICRLDGNQLRRLTFEHKSLRHYSKMAYVTVFLRNEIHYDGGKDSKP